MQIIDLTLSHLNLYCPATGEYIAKEDTGYNEDAKSLMGYWINEILDQPFIKDAILNAVWEAFALKYEEENDGLSPEYSDLEEFLSEYEHSTCIVFKIRTEGLIGDIAWFVLDMNTVLDE